MIVLDASVAIALLNQQDALHARAQSLLAAHVEDEFAMHVVTRAEVLVAPVRAGRAEVAIRALDRLEIGTVGLPEPDATMLAKLRVDTGVKLPDCCVLLAASRLGGAIATFDERLARSAREIGIAVID